MTNVEDGVRAINLTLNGRVARLKGNLVSQRAAAALRSCHQAFVAATLEESAAAFAHKLKQTSSQVTAMAETPIARVSRDISAALGACFIAYLSINGKLAACVK